MMFLLKLLKSSTNQAAFVAAACDQDIAELPMAPAATCEDVNVTMMIPLDIISAYIYMYVCKNDIRKNTHMYRHHFI